MSNRDIAKNLIDQIPESKLIYIIPYLQGATIPDETPTRETLEAMAEVEDMIATGKGEHFTGPTADLFSQILEE